MRALNASQLPSHPSLSSQQQNPPELQSFLTSALTEGRTFVHSYLPENFTLKGSDKQSPPSKAQVKLYSHDITAANLPEEVRKAGGGNEAWFARTSVHDNVAQEGTASWEEFDSGLRKNHSQHEKDYTPNVYDAHEVLNWDEQTSTLTLDSGSWTDVRMVMMEMAHQIPSPLNNRVFPVLVVTAKRQQSEFIVVQIPVATRGLPNAKYHDVPKVTGGMYCSVELGELIEEGKRVRWSMATASDAKGSLPMWMQKMGVPGAVVKDVGFFIKWCADKRKGGDS